MAVLGCGHPPIKSTTASITANVRFAVASPAPCGPLDRTFTLTSVPPTTGDRIVVNRSVEGHLPEVEGSRQFCVYRNIALATKLEPSGKWRVEAAGLGGCQITLAAGGNSVFFSSSTASCSTTGFP